MSRGGHCDKMRDQIHAAADQSGHDIALHRRVRWRVQAVEMKPQVPGQMDMYGNEEEQPARLRLVEDI